MAHYSSLLPAFRGFYGVNATHGTNEEGGREEEGSRIDGKLLLLTQLLLLDLDLKPIRVPKCPKKQGYCLENWRNASLLDISMQGRISDSSFFPFLHIFHRSSKNLGNGIDIHSSLPPSLHFNLPSCVCISCLRNQFHCGLPTANFGVKRVLKR